MAGSSYPGCVPRRLLGFSADRIILARGSRDCPEREQLVESVIRLYPGAEVIHRLDTPHNRIEPGGCDSRSRDAAGKRTLVFGVHQSAVRQSEEVGNTCPNYWHFSPYGYCFYGCKYCYLAGTRTVWHSPTVKIFLNLDEIIGRIDRAATGLAAPTAFYLGKLQDGLALDPLTGYSRVLVPFFARHLYARQVILTKSADVTDLLDLDHGGHTILSWSLLPPEVAAIFEENTPPVADRLAAMRACANHGYPVRAVLMPVLPVPGWGDIYPAFVRRLLREVPLARLTIGSICIYGTARALMDRKLGPGNSISARLCRDRGGDGRQRYPIELRRSMYRGIIEAARAERPDLEIGLCLEDERLFEDLEMRDARGRCNCVL